MTNQEIIEQLKSLKSHCEDFRDDEDCVWSKDVEALEKAIEALEKQIPKKAVLDLKIEPVIDENGAYIDADMFSYALCPICGNQVGITNFVDDENVFDDYCNYCGQAIDWSEVQ